MIAFSWHEKRTLTPKQRFEASILKDENDCWVWQGKIKRNLPVICIEQNYINAKLYSFIENVGEIFESNYTVVNNCGNNICVNPAHLNLENRVLQAFKKAKKFFDSLTNCKKCGFKKEGFIADGKGSLCCPECIKNRQKKRYAITAAVFICDCCGIKKLATQRQKIKIKNGGRVCCSSSCSGKLANIARPNSRRKHGK